MGNVDGSFAFIVSCGEGLWIQVNRHPAHIGKNMCVCLSFLCEPMMWQSSMLISLLVLSHEQIYIPIKGKHGSSYSGPITLLEPLVVLIGFHGGNMCIVERAQSRKRDCVEEGGREFTLCLGKM